MKLIDVRPKEGGREEADGPIGNSYNWYYLEIRFAEHPTIWWRYETGMGMLTFDKMLNLLEKLKNQIKQDAITSSDL